jgi:hypothetical protein
MRPTGLLLLCPMALCVAGMCVAGQGPDTIDQPVWWLVSAASATALALHGLLYAVGRFSGPSTRSAETNSAKPMPRARAI